MRFLLVVLSLLIPLLLTTATESFAESQTLPTEKGTLNVKLTYDSIEADTQAKINVDFLNPYTRKVQEHVDYTVSVSKGGQMVFATENLIHTSIGTVKIPVEFDLGEGVYTMDFEVEGILFNPIPTEEVSFDIIVKEAKAQPDDGVEPKGDDVEPKGDDGGGCLIATAAYGSEMAPQVQQLRELRDNTVLSTESGAAFMSGFNQFYYSFSPGIADFERENPFFRETVKIGLTPMLSSLSLLNHVEIDSEEEMLGYGISILLLNVGMYIGIPVFGILRLYQFKRN